MNAPRYSRLAARLLSRVELPRIGKTETEARRRGLNTIEQALVARQRKRRQRKAFRVGLAMVAAIGLWVGVRNLSPRSASPTASVQMVGSPLASGAVLLTAQGEAPLTQGSKLVAGGRVRTLDGGGAELKLSTGTVLTLQQSAALEVESQGATQRFTLSAGELKAKVAHLQTGERFLIDTPDAQVEVHGTVFDLSVQDKSSACPTRTRLRVREGLVEVRVDKKRIAYVPAGEHWPANCPFDAPATSENILTDSGPSPLPQEANRDSGTNKPHRVHSRHTSPDPAPSPTRLVENAAQASALREQSELFGSAVQLQKSGRTAEALTRYESLLQKYPQSPLRENTIAAKMRLLATSDPARAQHEARRYLNSYPNGFAQKEARQLLQEP